MAGHKMTDDDRRGLLERLDLARSIREDYAILDGIDPDTARQVQRLAYQDALEFANGVLEKYASEPPPSEPAPRPE